MCGGADIAQNELSESDQAACDIMSDCISSVEDKDESDDPQRLLDLQFPKTLWSILNFPVAPFWEHAADGKVDLGFTRWICQPLGHKGD